MSAKFDISERPNVLPWPPMILVSMILLAIGLEYLFPLRSYSYALFTPLHIPGLILFVAGISLDFWAIFTMRAHKTNIAPNVMAETLVTSGPFGFSRNPIYLGNTMMIFGLGLAFNRPWFLLTGILHIVLDYHLAIRREEQHLAARFGQDWEDYRSRVPRWIGWF